MLNYVLVKQEIKSTQMCAFWHALLASYVTLKVTFGIIPLCQKPPPQRLAGLKYDNNVVYLLKQSVTQRKNQWLQRLVEWGGAITLPLIQRHSCCLLAHEYMNRLFILMGGIAIKNYINYSTSLTQCS